MDMESAINQELNRKKWATALCVRMIGLPGATKPGQTFDIYAPELAAIWGFCDLKISRYPF